MILKPLPFLTRLMITLIVFLNITSVIASDKWGLNMTEGVTSFSRDVYDLHMIIFLICVVIGALVFGVMFYSILKHRKSKGVKAAQFHHSTTVEIVWTIIPFLILVIMAVPATSVLIKMENTGQADMTVKITGYQWHWRYDYIEEDISFYSKLKQDSNIARQLGSTLEPSSVENYLLDVDNRLVLPTNTRIRFLITADDVIHAWWVPDLGWKRDAIPGFINEAWTEINEPGIYRGQCAELCGKDHGFMPIVVEAVTPQEFSKWMSSKSVSNNDGKTINVTSITTSFGENDE